jgi:ABC-type nitrate/sulfonate/bicarbonate transport system permease component
MFNRLALREPPQPITSRLLAVTFVFLTLFVWFMLTVGEAERRIISPALLPSPLEVFGSLKSLLTERGLLPAIGATLLRVFSGFLQAVLIAVPLGIYAASQRWFESLIQPAMIGLRNVPIAALIPITLLWFGIGEEQKRWFIFLACFPFVFSDACLAVLNVPERYVDTARTLGANGWQIVRKVLVPLALPDIFSSLRALFGLAFGYIMLAELINTKTGLGALINVSQRLGKTEHVYMTLIVIALLAWLIDQLLGLAQRLLFPYKNA